MAAVGVDGLQGVGVMADEHIGTGVDEPLGIVLLLQKRTQRMLAAPMGRDNDIGRGTLLPQPRHTRHQAVHALIAHTGAVGQVGEILQRQLQGGHEVDRPWVGGQKHRLGGLVHGGSGPYGHHAGLAHLLPGVGESLAALVDAVVVGQVEVGDAMAPQGGQPFRLAAEDIDFLHGSLYLGDRALQIGHHNVGGMEERVDTGAEEGVDPLVADKLAHTPVEQHIAREDHAQRIAGSPRGSGPNSNCSWPWGQEQPCQEEALSSLCCRRCAHWVRVSRPRG